MGEQPLHEKLSPALHFILQPMLNFFKKKPKEKQPPILPDIDGMPIEAGDQVSSLRYDPGQYAFNISMSHRLPARK